MRNTTKCMRSILYMIAVLAIGVTSQWAVADEGVVRAKLSYGLASYSSPSAYGAISSNYSTLGLGVTYIFPSNIFADFTMKTSGSDASYNANSVTSGLVSSDQKFVRNENIITIGMPLDNGMQGNAGIFTAETVFKLAQFGQFSQKMTGITAGIGKGFPINQGMSGTVGVNGAGALLNATNTDRFGNSSGSDLSYGLSAGAAYNYMFNKNFGFSADAKFQSYFIKYSSFSGDEKILSLALSLIGQF
jgi:hypothetical protein